MTIFEIANELPNGFHDSEVHTLQLDYPGRSIEIALDVWIGTMVDPPSTRETYRRGVLSITGLQYCAMDMPDERYPHADPGPLTVDLAESKAFVPAASFGCRLWVNEWNGFIHLSAQTAEFVWTGAPVNRGA
jgi:hypothetical protein